MRVRQAIFYGILLITIPLWLPILLVMFSYDIADNFRGQINSGFGKLLNKDGSLRDVI